MFKSIFRICYHINRPIVILVQKHKKKKVLKWIIRCFRKLYFKRNDQPINVMKNVINVI